MESPDVSGTKHIAIQLLPLPHSAPLTVSRVLIIWTLPSVDRHINPHFRICVPGNEHRPPPSSVVQFPIFCLFIASSYEQVSLSICTCMYWVCLYCRAIKILSTCSLYSVQSRPISNEKNMTWDGLSKGLLSEWENSRNSPALGTAWSGSNNVTGTYVVSLTLSLSPVSAMLVSFWGAASVSYYHNDDAKPATTKYQKHSTMSIYFLTHLPISWSQLGLLTPLWGSAE